KGTTTANGNDKLQNKIKIKEKPPVAEGRGFFYRLLITTNGTARHGTRVTNVGEGFKPSRPPIPFGGLRMRFAVKVVAVVVVVD
ncbi:MAG: hypothetical protein LBB93_00845, partial [Elusimicrobiota bacterium]|nr:hypothetical protein [Elusimicrobiota bacterium]